MDMMLFVFFIFSLQLVCFLVGSFSSKKMKTKEDYFLAGKTLRFFPLMMTFIATQVGGCLMLGSAEEAYRFGWKVLLYPLGASLGLFFLGAGVGKKLAGFNVSTVAQIFETVYQSKTLKKIASLLSMVSLFMLFVAQVIASKKFMVSSGLDNNFLFLLFWVIVIAYTAIGGLKAVVATDVVQACFFMIAFIICIAAAFMFPATDLNFLPQTITETAFDAKKLIGWLLMPLLFMLIEQDMAQRCFAASTPKVIGKASLIAAAVTFITSLIPIYFGVLAKDINFIPKSSGSVLMEMIQLTTNPIITALVGAAILAAIISTADSLINAITSNLLQDFNFGSRLKKVSFSQGITAIIACLGMCISFYFDNIVDLMLQSYELSVYCLFVPVIMALFIPKGNKLSASLAMLFGALSFFFFELFGLSSLVKEIICLLSSLSGFILGQILSAKFLLVFLRNKKLNH